MIVIEPEEPGEMIEEPPLTLRKDSESSVSIVKVNGVCPSLGEAWIQFSPVGK